MNQYNLSDSNFTTIRLRRNKSLVSDKCTSAKQKKFYMAPDLSLSLTVNSMLTPSQSPRMSGR